MSKINTLTKKQFFALRSGQVFWHVTLNQFNEYNAVQHTCFGKKENMSDQHSDGSTVTFPVFVSKNHQPNRLFQLYIGEFMLYPKHKLFKTRRAVDVFITEHKKGLRPDTDLVRIVRRVRKPGPVAPIVVNPTVNAAVEYEFEN